MYMLPVMCLLYCFQFMDKLSTSYASILGLREDLNMVGDMYSWTATAFYLGYLAFEFPASMLYNGSCGQDSVSIHYSMGNYFMFAFGSQYPGFIALRTILGMLELSVTPAFTIITSQWYKKRNNF